jgi:hypothetical protein
MTTAAARRPVLNHLIHHPRRQQRTAVALVAELGAALAPGRIPAAGRRAGRIGARRARGVARAALQLSLKLLNARFQLLDAPIHPQQHLDNDLPPRVVDRLRLSALHPSRFDAPRLCPPTPLNAYHNPPICRTFAAQDGPLRVAENRGVLGSIPPSLVPVKPCWFWRTPEVAVRGRWRGGFARHVPSRPFR